MARAGLLAGVPTLLVLVPVILLLRRLHPAWRRGDRLRATWSVSLGLAAGSAAWMIPDEWAAALSLSEAAGFSLVGAGVLLFAFLASRWRASARALGLAAWLSPASLLLALLPGFPSGGAGTELAAVGRGRRRRLGSRGGTGARP